MLFSHRVYIFCQHLQIEIEIGNTGFNMTMWELVYVGWGYAR